MKMDNSVAFSQLNIKLPHFGRCGHSENSFVIHLILPKVRHVIFTPMAIQTRGIWQQMWCYLRAYNLKVKKVELSH
jgi:hypothetical protein